MPARPLSQPLELLRERRAATGQPPGRGLERLHGGGLLLAEDCLYANFVATLDGIVAIPPMPRSNEFIVGDSDADRSFMGLLHTVPARSSSVSGSCGRARAARVARQKRSSRPRPGSRRQLRHALEHAAGSGGRRDHRERRDRHGASAVRVGLARAHVGAGAGRLRGRLPSAAIIATLGPARRIHPADLDRRRYARGHRRILARPARTRSVACSRRASTSSSSRRHRCWWRRRARLALSLVEGADLTPAARGAAPTFAATARTSSPLRDRPVASPSSPAALPSARTLARSSSGRWIAKHSRAREHRAIQSSEPTRMRSRSRRPPRRARRASRGRAGPPRRRAARGRPPPPSARARERGTCSRTRRRRSRRATTASRRSPASGRMRSTRNVRRSSRRWSCAARYQRPAGRRARAGSSSRASRRRRTRDTSFASARRRRMASARRSTVRPRDRRLPSRAR